MPPDLELDRLDCRAHIDYLSVISYESRPDLLPVLSCIQKWHKKKGESTQTLTLHDPTKADIMKVVEAMGNPSLFVLELAVDFTPKASMSMSMGDREDLLCNTFVALAARFRPEDITDWGYGSRGGLTEPKQKPLPFHQRLPSPNEELIYGGRGNYLQSKLYLKRVDQGKDLKPEQHLVRLELTCRRWPLHESGMNFLGDLIGYEFRSKFTKHFRVVSGPRLRLHRKLTDSEKLVREKRMKRAWATAGVGKFAVSRQLPFETDAFSAQRIRARAKKQLPLEHYVLLRDQAANARIGDAFKKLERRMTA